MKALAYLTDLGGCLFPDVLETARNILIDNYPGSAENIEPAMASLWKHYAYSGLPDKHVTNNASHNLPELQMWNQFVKDARIPATAAEIVALTQDCWKPLDPSYVQLLEQLHHQGVILGIVSNNTTVFWERQREAMRLDNMIATERVILSCNYGVSKKSPGLELYKAAVRACGVPAENIVFVDDRPHNIEWALKAGIGAAVLHPNTINWGASYMAHILWRMGMLKSAWDWRFNTHC